jgi:predicted dehydrogenase
MALEVAAADEMMGVAEDEGRMLFVAQCLRFWPAYEAFAQGVGEETWGPVASAHFWRLSATPAWSESDWIINPELSGGASLDLHLHDSDFINSVWGLPPAVSSVGTAVFSPVPVDHILTQYLYDDVMVTAEAGWGLPASYPFTMAFRLVAEQGTLEWSADDGPSPTVYPAEGEPYRLELSAETGYQREMAYFVRCIESGTQPERVMPASARDSIRLAAAERSSVEQGRPVQL